MNTFFTIIKSDYLQRTRSYTFLITLCISVAVGYTFIPAPGASYATIQLGEYIGVYNAAWFGYVTAMMSSVFLSLIGFYLINSGIKRDRITQVGQITAATSISNTAYLCTKALSNFAILMTILAVLFGMSIILFFLYSDGYPFDIMQFITPFLFIPVPAIACISILAVLFEMILGKYSVLQNIGFFIVFGFLVSLQSRDSFNTANVDLFGSQVVINAMVDVAQTQITDPDMIELNIGYTIGNKSASKTFIFEGVSFPISYNISRLLWVGGPLLLLCSIAPFFHRFDIKEALRLLPKKYNEEYRKHKRIQIDELAEVTPKIGLYTLYKMELYMLTQNSSKWLWLPTLSIMIAMIFVPITISHQILLPLVWFLQIARIASITSKELTSNVAPFAFASYKPLQRLLTSQLLAAITLLLVLASPLLIRLLINNDSTAVSAILLGALFIISLAAFFGIVTRGKKLFEIVFFIVTYTNMSKLPYTDYFGGLTPAIHHYYILIPIVVVLYVGTYSMRKLEIRRL